MAKTANSANSAKSAKMAVVMGKGVTNSKTAAEKVAAPQQLILLPTAAEAPKAEAPKAEAPKAEAPKAEAPKAEAPKAEAPKTVAPKAEPKPEATKTDPKAEAPKAVATKAEPKHKMSIDELTDKAERVFLLQGKYAEVRAKRKQLQSFTIKHEEETAQLTLVDAKGMSIVTHNPTAIKHLLDDWAKDLDNHLSDIENQLRKELENLD